jgi:hypothetical protein
MITENRPALDLYELVIAHRANAMPAWQLNFRKATCCARWVARKDAKIKPEETTVAVVAGSVG